MGNRSRESADTAKSSPQADQGGGAGDQPTDFCQLIEGLGFEVVNHAAPAVGDAVRLVLGPVPRIDDAKGEEIGELRDSRQSPVRNCLLDGWVLEGEVTSFDSGSGVGQLRAHGSRPGP
jgi:hypothetical protein